MLGVEGAFRHRFTLIELLVVKKTISSRFFTLIELLGLPAIARSNATATARAFRQRFTLIELLVVIAIIAILASLLLPVLGRAQKRARYVQCVNNLHHLGVSIVNYQTDNDSYYPLRTVNAQASWPGATYLKFGPDDDRVKFSSYIDIDGQLLCPLAPPVPKLVATATAYQLMTHYEMWFGMEMVRGNRATAMLRGGDEPQWNGETFQILASDADIDVNGHWGFNVWSAHSDDSTMIAGGRNDNTWLDSYWWSQVAGRAEIDRNFLYTDGHVEIWRRLGFRDSRLTQVPYYSWPVGFTAWSYLPAQ